MTASSVLTPAPATQNPADRPTNPAAEAWAAFQKDTAGHQLTVLHEDGLYRHFRMSAPGTRWGSWDIVTWPGHLATSGDIADGLTFSREPDMVRNFFGKMRGNRPYFADDAPSIDFRYWAEKLQGDQRDNVKTYVHGDFLQYVKEILTDRVEIERMTQEQADQLLAEVEEIPDYEPEVRQWLNAHDDIFSESWEHSFKDYTFHFQVACYAINAAVQAYLARPLPSADAQ
jgi:hypothetical protein